MSFPWPPLGGIITFNTGKVVPVGTFPATKSTVPKVYPDPWFDIVTDSTLWSLLTTTLHSAPVPSPRIGLLYKWY